MNTDFAAFNDKDVPQREYNYESGFPDFSTSVSSSTNEEFRERPPSRADWYEGCEEVQLGERYESQIFDEFENNNNDKVESCYLSWQEHSRSTKRRERVSRSPKFKGRRARSVKPSTYHARKRRHQRVAAGWAEVFSTISEEPSMQEPVQEARCSSFRPRTVNTTMATQTSCSATEASTSTSKLRATPVVAMSTSSESLGIQVPEPASKRALSIETSSSTATLEKLSTESDFQAASIATLVFGQNSSSPDDVPKTEGSVDSAGTSDGLLLLHIFLPALCSGLEKLSIQNLYATSSDSPLTEDRSNAMAEDELPRPQDEHDEGPTHVVAAIGDNTINVEPHLHSAPNEKPFKLEQLGQPDRNCVLVLTVSLLVAVFFVTSVFFARTSFRFGVSPDHSPEKAANKVDLDTNATNLGGKQRSVPVANSAAALDRPRISSTLFPASPHKQSTFVIAKNGRVRKTEMIDGVGVTRSSHPLTNLENLLSVFDDSSETYRFSSTNDDDTTESTTIVAPFVDEPGFVGNDETFVYRKTDKSSR